MSASVAISAGMAASAAASAEQAHNDLCQVVIKQAKIETTEDKQEYSECVQYLYPVHSADYDKNIKQGVCIFIVISILVAVILKNIDSWMFSDWIMAGFGGFCLTFIGFLLIALASWLLS